MKSILITQCPDKLMWYSGYVGCEVPLYEDGDDKEIIWSREPSGHKNIVNRSDCNVIERTSPSSYYKHWDGDGRVIVGPSKAPAPAPRTLIGELTEDEIRCLIEYCSIRESEAVGDRKYLEAEQMKKRGEFFKIALEKSNGRPKSN